jgi:hypothetical protein
MDTLLARPQFTTTHTFLALMMRTVVVQCSGRQKIPLKVTFFVSKKKAVHFEVLSILF